MSVLANASSDGLDNAILSIARPIFARAIWAWFNQNKDRITITKWFISIPLRDVRWLVELIAGTPHRRSIRMRYKLLSGPGSHPELGDIVYDGDTEVGEVEFFYARTGADTWSVKVSDHDADPVDVRMVDVNDGERVLGRRFVLATAAASTAEPSGSGVQGVSATTELGQPTIVTNNSQES
jgi:hypothetical protein